MKQILFSRHSLLGAMLALLTVALWGCGSAVPATPTATTAAMATTPTAMTGATEMTPTAMTGMMETTPTTMSGAMGTAPTAMSGAMGSGTPSAGMAGGEMTWVTATQDYSLTLRLGPLPRMLAPDQVQGATAGEVMIGGAMAMTGMGGMAPNYHIELAVNDIKSGVIITDKSVVINLTSVTTGAKQTVPIAMMYNVQEGPADTHFGNNVALEPGNYTVNVDVAGEKGTFNITVQAIPATPSAMGTPGQMMMGITPTP